MRRKSRTTERRNQRHFFENASDVEVWHVLTVLLEGQFNKENFDLGLVVFEGVQPLVLRKDRLTCGLTYDSVSISVFAAGFDALIPKSLFSVTILVSAALYLSQGSDQTLSSASVLTL